MLKELFKQIKDAILFVAFLFYPKRRTIANKSPALKGALLTKSEATELLPEVEKTRQHSKSTKKGVQAVEKMVSASSLLPEFLPSCSPEIVATVQATHSPLKEISRRERNKEENQGWVLVKNDAGSVFVHEQLYNALGITAFKSVSQDATDLVSSSRFIFSSRELSFYPETELATGSISTTKPKGLMTQFQQFSNKRSFNQEYLTRMSESLNPLINNPLVVEIVQRYAVESREIEYKEADDPMVVFNPKRREEIFLPFTIDTASEQGKLGLHVYPWASRTEAEFKFSGFEQFVTAMCMFGASLKGVDQYGARFPLIKHDIHFFSGQKIMLTEVDHPNAYESAQFEDFKKLLSLVCGLSKINNTSRLYCHLPYYDYILFGMQQVIRGNMEACALEGLVQHIFKKRNEYIVRINELSEEQGVEVTVASPFDNIFGELESEEKIIEAFEALKLIEQPSEAALVQHCLKLLMTNRHQPEHQQAWQDFVSIIGEDKISTLEDLFKIGNAVMVAVASHGYSPYQVCSLLPLSEKQIQVGYADYSKKLKKKYPAIMNFTYLDSFLGYNFTNKGLAFYFGDSPSIANKLIENGILKGAFKNPTTHVGGKGHQSLQEFLKEFERANPPSIKEKHSPSRKPLSNLNRTLLNEFNLLEDGRTTQISRSVTHG